MILWMDLENINMKKMKLDSFPLPLCKYSFILKKRKI